MAAWPSGIVSGELNSWDVRSNPARAQGGIILEEEKKLKICNL
jgi:hypothetical protein